MFIIGVFIVIIRNKNNIPFDYYKEVLNNYRNILYDLNIQDIQDYTIKNSTLKKNELFNFFDQYGKQGIKINIGF